MQVYGNNMGYQVQANNNGGKYYGEGNFLLEARKVEPMSGITSGPNVLSYISNEGSFIPQQQVNR
jgi:hypothetical protein